MRIHRFRYAPIAVAILAAACGGDGGGGGGGATTPSAPAGPTFVQISMANQDSVARAAIGSILPFTSVSSIGITPSPAAAKLAQANTASIRDRGIVMALTSKAANLAGRRQTAAPGMARALAVHTDTMACAQSGAVTVSWDDRDNDAMPSKGDTMTMSFVQCRDSTDMTINGSVLLTLASATATDLAGALTLQQLVVAGAGSSVLMNGALSFAVSETALSNGVRDLATYTVAGTGLIVATSGGTYTDTLTYRAGFSVTEDDFVPNAVGASGISVITANGNFRSNALGGDLALTTAQAFRLTDPDPGPREGQLMIGGLNNTKLGLTAVSNMQVRMDLCDDGDGAWEATKTVEWTTLIP